MGHVSHPTIADAVTKGLVEGVELDSTSTAEFCEACVQAKATRQPFPKETSHRAKKYGELIHTDLWGPAQTATIGGCLYYISFTDDFSRETQLAFLKQKSDALAAFKAYETRLTTQHDGTKIKVLRSDRGGEYLSAKFDAYLQEKGIKRELTVHDSPQQNGVAERLNRTIVELARAMLIAKNMPKFLWAEAVNYATWLKNRLPSHAIPGHTPYDLINGRRPNLSQAREFGGKIFVHLPNAGKLELRAEEAVFVGIDLESKGYRVYWPAKRWVSVERNVSFVPMMVEVADDIPNEGESEASADIPSTADNVQHVTPTAEVPKTPPQTSKSLPVPRTPRTTRVRPPAGYYRALNEGERASFATLDPPDEPIHWALAAVEPEPTLKEALNGPDAEEWQEAIDYEIGQLERLGAWEIVDAP